MKASTYQLVHKHKLGKVDGFLLMATVIRAVQGQYWYSSDKGEKAVSKVQVNLM